MNSDVTAGKEKSPFRAGERILFQGDSITDADRGDGLGNGYVARVAARLAAEWPGLEITVENRGIAGNQIHDLVARWDEDALALKPDVLSILIGFNDTAAEMPLAEFEEAYDALLEQTKAALPNVRLVLCEPFALFPASTDGKPDRWETNVRQRARIVEKLATRYGATFVRFQKILDDACKRAPAAHWLYDGIHPSGEGHQLMADEWMRAVAQSRR